MQLRSVGLFHTSDVLLRGLLAFGLALALAVGCGRTNRRHQNPAVDRDHQELEGPIADSLEKSYQSEFLDGCDTRFKEMKVEMAKTLDKRSAEIAEFMKTHTKPDSKYHRVELGVTFFVDLKGEPNPRPGWQSGVESWRDSYELFKSIRDEKIDERWVDLDRRVRSLTLNDELRLQHGQNMTLTRENQIPLEKGAKLLDECLSAKDCTQVAFDVDTEEVLQKNVHTKTVLEELSKTTAPDPRRALLKRLQDEVNLDLAWRFQFRKNESVRITGDNVLELELDAGSFKAVKEEVAQLVEKIWKTSDLGLKIVWGNRDSKPELFTMLLGNTPGSRPFVSDKTVNLFPGTAVRSVAHEIGHVLGFRDHYYTIWRPETCDYEQQFTEEDLMSDSQGGSVTPEEWSTLSSAYRKN